MYVCMYVCVSIHLSIYVYMYAYVCVCVCVCVCLCVCIAKKGLGSGVSTWGRRGGGGESPVRLPPPGRIED